MSENAKSIVDGKVAGKKVMVFSKSTCPYCASTKKLLKGYNLSASDFEVMELDKLSHKEMSEIQDYLLKLTGARSVPRVFVNGKSVGGNDDTQAAHKSGALKKMIEA